MRMIPTAALLAALFLIGPTIALARSTFAPATLEKYFTLDWQVVRDARGPRIEGYVYSLGMATDRMRLSIEQLETRWLMSRRPLGLDDLTAKLDHAPFDDLDQDLTWLDNHSRNEEGGGGAAASAAAWAAARSCAKNWGKNAGSIDASDPNANGVPVQTR